MSGNDWWRRYDDADDPSGDGAEGEGEAAAPDIVGVPAHWLEGRRQDSAAAEPAAARPPAPPTTPPASPTSAPPAATNRSETISEVVPPSGPTPVALTEIIEPDAPPTPAGPMRGKVLFGLATAALLVVALVFASRSDGEGATVDSASIEPPAGFVADPSLTRRDLGLGSQFSDPVAFRSDDSLLVIYSRSLSSGEAAGEADRVSSDGVFANELTAGSTDLSVSVDEPVGLGLGGRRVRLTSPAGAEVQAITFVQSDDAGEALVVMVLSGPTEIDLEGIARNLSLR